MTMIIKRDGKPLQINGSVPLKYAPDLVVPYILRTHSIEALLQAILFSLDGFTAAEVLQRLGYTVENQV